MPQIYTTNERKLLAIRLRRPFLEATERNISLHAVIQVNHYTKSFMRVVNLGLGAARRQKRTETVENMEFNQSSRTEWSLLRELGSGNLPIITTVP